VVDHHVDTVQRELRHHVPLGQVGHDRFAADGVGDRAGTVRVAIDHDHLGTGCGEGFRARAADTAGGAGHQGTVTGQVGYGGFDIVGGYLGRHGWEGYGDHPTAAMCRRHTEFADQWG